VINTDAPVHAAFDLADVAGLDLSDDQGECLAAMLAVREDNRWATSDVAVALGRDAEQVLTVRALAGLLLFDERILWTAYRPITYRCAFDHFTHLLHRIGDAGHAPADLTACRGNGRERVYRTSTAAEVRFTGHRANHRGMTCDTLIVQESDHWTHEQQAQLMPVMASVSNPQLVRA
jgi:hypothetical protein